MGRTDDKDARAGVRRQESEGNREGMGRKGGYGGRGTVGGTKDETTSVSWVCVKVREVLCGGCRVR